MFHQFDKDDLRAIEQCFLRGPVERGTSAADNKHASAIADLFGLAPATRLADRRPPWPLAWIAKLDQLFIVNPPDAPGYFFAGGVMRLPDVRGQMQSHSVTGLGLTAAEALYAASGEIAEMEALYATGGICGEAGDGHAGVTKAEALLERLPASMADQRASLAWTAATCWADAQPVLVPVALCSGAASASVGAAPLVALSEGCGAGATLADALTHGIFELVERDAFALWWYGGRPTRAIEFDTDADAEFTAFRGNVRGTNCTRHDLLLDITTDLGVPVAAAVSWDAAGRKIACGTAARSTYGAAIRAAYKEMCQLEFGYHIVCQKKRQSGGKGLGAADLARLDQGERLIAHKVPMLDAGARRRRLCQEDCGDEAAGGAENTLSSLARRADLLWVRIGADEASLKVVKVLSADLQPGSPKIQTARLRRVLEQTGGTEEYKTGQVLV